MKRRALAAALLLATAIAQAQSEVPIRLIVGYAAGGPVDGGARSFAPVLARELGREAGLPAYEVIGWYGVYGPPRLAPELTARLNAAVNRALADADLRKLWSEQGYELWPGKPELLAAQQLRDLEMWRGVTRDIKVD